MDSKQMKIAAVAAVLVIVVAAVAVYFVTKDKDNGSDESKVTFLMQDNVGVYFWAEGSGDTVLDALKDACKEFEISFTASQDKDGKDTGISSLFGIESKEVVDNKWNYWAQYAFVDGKWEFSTSYMYNLQSKDVDYFAVVYGDGTNAPVAMPKDAKVWNFSTAGTTFLIKSETGMDFVVNGEGKTVLDAFKNAVETYHIPVVYSKDAAGADYGITSLYGIESYQDTETGAWYWWQQCKIDSETGGFVLEDKYMNEILSSDYSEFGIIFAPGFF